METTVYIKLSMIKVGKGMWYTAAAPLIQL